MWTLLSQVRARGLQALGLPPAMGEHRAAAACHRMGQLGRVRPCSAPHSEPAWSSQPVLGCGDPWGIQAGVLEQPCGANSSRVKRGFCLWFVFCIRPCSLQCPQALWWVQRCQKAVLPFRAGQCAFREPGWEVEGRFYSILLQFFPPSWAFIL